MKYLIQTVLFCLVLGLVSCKDSTQTNQKEEAVENKAINNRIEGEETGYLDGSDKRLKPSNQEGAGERLSGFDIDRDLPLLAPEINFDDAMKKIISEYGTSVITGTGISSEKDILSLLELRDEKLIPYFYNLVESMEEAEEGFINKNYEQLAKELNLLGMDMNFAEGTFVDMGTYPVMENWIDKYASEGLKLYTQFRVASSEANNGEYPYLNMEPRIQKVIIGEKLAKLKDSSYFNKIKDEYEDAVMSLTDIHKVYNPNNRQEESFLVNGITTEMYPFVTEKKTRSSFVRNQKNSRYSQLVEKILENPSEISNKPEQIYVIVTEWLDTEQMAQRRVIGHLEQGEDVPHYLPIIRGDGSTRYAVTYRFFENEEKANEALGKIQKEIPSANLIYCSVKGSNLYQIGPANDI
ncbi:MAG: hypothetical protein MRZ79_12660 [Bacteroidia bacterium]|nr:hypothetical protein [Bacteroidia bacterium]